MSYSLNLKLTTPDLSNTFSIVGYIDKNTKYEVGYGYLDEDNKVWICTSSGEEKSSYPWFIVNADGTLKFSERNEHDDVIFTRRNCVNVDIEYIKNNINKCVDEYRKNPLPTDNKMELYEIKQEDSCLSVLIKLFLNDTKIDLVSLGTLIDDPVTISNLKSSLKRTDLSLKNFIRWVSVLGLKYTIILEDNGLGLSNLNGDKFIYQSSTNEVSRIDKNNDIRL